VVAIILFPMLGASICKYVLRPHPGRYGSAAALVISSIISQRYQCCGMTHQLLYQYHLSLSFSTFCRPAKGNLAVSIVHYTIALLKRPHSTGAAPFTGKRTIQPLHLRKLGAGEEEASFTGLNFPKDG
jgi:hypothetical protein